MADKPYSEPFTSDTPPDPTTPAPATGPEAFGSDQVTIIMPSGTRAVVDADRAADLIATRGARVETPGEEHEAWLKNQAEEHPVQAGIEAGVSASTLGFTDALAHGDEAYAARRKYNPNAAMVGEGLAYLNPEGLLGGLSAAGKEIGGLATEALGGGLGARVVGSGVAGATEMTAIGAGQGVSQLGLSGRDTPMDLEHIATTIGSSALTGAGVGAAFGIGGKLLEEGAVAAKDYAAKKAEQWTAKEAPAAVDNTAHPDIGGMDEKQTKDAIRAAEDEDKVTRANAVGDGEVAKKAEIDSLNLAKDAEAKDLFDDASAFKEKLRKDPNYFLPTEDKELAKVLRKSKLQIMRAIENEKGFIRNRASTALLNGLETQEGAINRVLEHSGELTSRAEQERDALYDALPKSSYTNDVMLNAEHSAVYNEWKGIENPKKPLPQLVSGEELDAFRDAVGRGDVQMPSAQRVENAQKMLDENLAFQDRVKSLRAAPASERLDTLQKYIDDAKAGLNPTDRLDALKAHLNYISDKPMGRKIAGVVAGAAAGSAGFALGGFVGGAAAGAVGNEAGHMIYDKLVRKIGIGNKLRKAAIAEHVANFFDKTAKGIKRVTPLASKIIGGIAYGPKDYVDGVMGPANYSASSDKLVNAWRERARELNAMTEPASPPGTNVNKSTIGNAFQVRMHAREALNQRLQAFWAMNPDWGNGIEAVAARRLEFMAEKLPRNPAAPHLQIGPDTWQPSKAELAKFARYMQAVEQPDLIVQRFSAGNMTPEDAEVLKRVYPAMYDDVRKQIMSKLPEVKSMPYQKRLALSIYLDIDCDPALTGTAIAGYQSLYQQQAAQPPPPKQGNFKSSEKPTDADKYGQ